MKNQRGSISLPVILSIVFGLGLAASAYLNYVQNQSAASNQKLLQGTITDLKYQLNKDQIASAQPSPTVTPLATPEPTATPTPTPSPAVAGTGSVNILQQGIKLTVADPVADLTYDMTTSAGYTDVSALSTRSLLAKYPACKPSAANNALGFIVRKKPNLKSSGTPIKTLGTYNFFYLAPSGYCATDTAGRNTLAAARAAIKNTVLPSLSN